MKAPIPINRVLRLAQQGTSEVFICQGEDGQKYFVKGGNRDRKELYFEWICAHMARSFGLPVADFCLVEVDEFMHEYLDSSLSDIGFGVWFASKAVPRVLQYEAGMKGDIPENLQRDLLVFDRWIQNEDRTVGNPNLLFEAKTKHLTVIDHNLAFEPEFNEEQFFKYHVFADQKACCFADLAVRAGYQVRMEKVLQEVTFLIKESKQLWPWSDLEQTRPFRLDSEAILSILDQYKSSQFWSLK